MLKKFIDPKNKNQSTPKNISDLKVPFPQWKSNKEFKGKSIEEKRLSEKRREQDEALTEIAKKNQEEEISKRAQALGLAYADLNIIPIDPEALALVEEEKARSARIAIVARKGREARAALADPESQEALAILNKLKEKGFNIAIIFVSQNSLEKAWKGYKNVLEKREESENSVELSSKALSEFEEGIKSLGELKEKIASIPVTGALNIIIAGALKTNASDIHLEPYKNFVRLRYRLDGVLQNIADLPLTFYPYAVSRIKMLAQLKLNVSNIPQDGRLTVNIGSETIDIRVSSIPGDFGESFVMRILKQQTISLQFEDLGLRGKALEILKHELQKPNGMVLTTGPTGSGKTTTLYAFLNKLNTPERKIITLEDPIEYRMEGIEQTQIDSQAGYTFASGLRSILRQDPDVILVGEIRDEETAKTATQAALTGHVVFSTLHTNDAPGAIPRLINLGVDPTLLGPAVNAFIAQRLVRKLCQFCREPYQPADETIEKIKKILEIISPEAKVAIPNQIKTLYRSKGCPKCNNLGYKGRVGIFEVFQITPRIEKIALKERVPTSDIKKAAIEDGMITMLQDGILKAINGITTLEEIYRTTGEGDYVAELMK